MKNVLKNKIIDTFIIILKGINMDKNITLCEKCMYYDYDDEYECYTCLMNLDEDEFLNVERIPLDKAVEMVLNNELRDGKTQAAVLKVKLLRDKGLW